MQLAAMLAYALAVGLTLSGLAGTAVEIATGRRLGFRPPFVTPERFARSLALTCAAGPFMLANEAIAAYKAGVIEARALAAWALVAMIWSLAAGILAVELALAASAHLG